MVLPRQTNIVSIWLIWPRRIKYILAWDIHWLWVRDMCWTRLDVGIIARRIVPRIDFLQSNRKNASKLGQKKIHFFPKMWYRKTPGLGRGEGEGITSPISLLTTSLPSIRMVTSSLALSQADDQIIFVKINYNNSTSKWERTKSQP